MPVEVIVVPHDPAWSEQFRTESGAIQTALGANAMAIHHIGSTAIPSIVAKPIIDILVEVADIHAVEERNPAMVDLGYESMGEFGIAGRRYFRKDDQSGRRTHQVHIFLTGSDHIRRHLAFRDFLNAHAEYARQYSDLKSQLAQQFPDSIESYMDGKDAFIKHVDQLAAI